MIRTLVLSAFVCTSVFRVDSQIEPQKIAHVKEIKAKKVKKAKVEKKEAVSVTGESKIKR